MGNYRRYGGVSRQVRKVVLNSSLGSSPIAEPVRVSAVLGFKGKAAEREKIQECVQQQYAGEVYLLQRLSFELTPMISLALNTEGRMLIREIQQESGTYVEGGIPFPEAPVDDDNEWINDYGSSQENDHTEESRAVIHAVRDMRLRL